MSKKGRVVVVDDSDYSRARLVELVEDLGYEVIGQAASGQKAVLLAKELNPDLFLTDFVMSDGDGYYVAREAADTPVIIVATGMEPAWKESAEDIGPRITMLDKSDRNAIIAAIKKALGDED